MHKQTNSGNTKQCDQIMPCTKTGNRFQRVGTDGSESKRYQKPVNEMVATVCVKQGVEWVEKE